MKYTIKPTHRRSTCRWILATAGPVVMLLLVLGHGDHLWSAVLVTTVATAILAFLGVAFLGVLIPKVGRSITLLSVAVALALSGCAEKGQGERASQPPTVLAPGREPIALPPSRNVKDLVLIGFDTSASNVAERPILIDQLINVVIPEAARRKAFVEVMAVGDRAYNGASTIIQLDFRPPSDNPTVAGETTASAASKLLTALDEQLPRVPAQASDPIGFLRRAGDRVEQYPTARVLAIYLGDGASSTRACDLGLMAVDAASAAATADDCITATGGPFTLRNAKDQAEFWLLGVGLDVDGGMDTNRALGIRRVLTAVIDQAKGRVTRASIDAIGGAR